jgi:hypothetical protein
VSVPRIELAYQRLRQGLGTNGDGLLAQAQTLEPGDAIEFEHRGVVYWLIRPTAENLASLAKPKRGEQP